MRLEGLGLLGVAVLAMDSLDTTTGLRAPGPNVAVRKMSNSEPKWANAKKYVKIVKSYTLTIRRHVASAVAPMAGENRTRTS